jgi:saccharopine dehydrogenase-like NADP-dependent oxidoreductase
MNILVLGGGAQGRVIAADLARSLPDSRITVADVRRPELASLPNLGWIEADCSDATAAARLMSGHDLVVGALPSRHGLATMHAAIEAGRHLVDVSFSAENPLALDAAARGAGIAIIPDCGLAPGLSNLLIGRAVALRGMPDDVLIMVGGVAQDASRPYGYCVTWSLDDLLEEYTRPARIVRGGERVTVPVFSALERVLIPGAGEMEAFYSDGLRTLMDTLPGVPDMGEKTLRWPGHAAAVQPLVAEGRLVGELRARCTLTPPADLAAMLVRVRWRDRTDQAVLVDRYDPATGMTAMARTTALTTAVTAQWLARGHRVEPGVQPLEHVARDGQAYAFVLEQMATRGVKVGWQGD